MILHWRIRTGSDWWFSKILRIRTWSDSILSDQDWTRTEKFHSPLISAFQRCADSGVKRNFWLHSSHHVRMHRGIFYIPNTLMKLII